MPSSKHDRLMKLTEAILHGPATGPAGRRAEEVRRAAMSTLRLLGADRADIETMVAGVVRAVGPSRPNMTVERACLLVAAGAVAGCRLPLAAAMLEQVLARVRVRQTKEAVTARDLTRAWSKPKAVQSREEWTERTAGVLAARYTRPPRDGDVRGWATDFGKAWRDWYDGSVVAAVAELIRVPFPFQPPAGLEDPARLASAALGRPLSYAEAALLAACVCGPGGEPPWEVVAAIAACLAVYPKSLISPFHAAIALGAHHRPAVAGVRGAARDWYEPWPMATEVCEKLMAGAVTEIAHEMHDMSMLAGGRLTGDSATLIAHDVTKIVTEGTCRCGHHDSRMLACRGAACGTACCRHSLRPWIDPPRRAELLEPLGVACRRFLLGRTQGVFRDDLKRGLLIPALVAQGKGLEWRTRRGLASFDVAVADVGFVVCPCGARSEGKTCANAACGKTFVPATTGWAIEPQWTVALSIDGWFAYNEERLCRCPGKGCPLWFRENQAGTPCPRCKAERTLPWRTVLIKEVQPPQPALPGNDVLRDHAPDDRVGGVARIARTKLTAVRSTA